ncbi:MAG: ExbD/TolR family protein [bacterium]
MAFKPSLRRHHKEVSTELNLNPLLDMMTVLIPLLLANAQFAKIGVIELNLPPAVSAAGSGSGSAIPKEEKRTLDLTVSVTDKGFYISSAVAVLTGAAGAAPAIPVNADGEYDFDALSQKLYEIKKKVGNEFADPDAIVIQAEPKIRYQILVSTMDAARSIRLDEKIVGLFPNVALSAGVF